MTFKQLAALGGAAAALFVLTATGFAQQPPYDVFPKAEPPYFRVPHGHRGSTSRRLHQFDAA